MDSQEAATNEEGSSSSGDQKKAKTSPSPPASHDHQDGGDDVLPPPPPLPSLHLCSLPDIAHAAIASYLTMVDMHCMMESSPWLLEAYGGKVKELRLVYHTQGPIPPTPILLSIMSRRPNVISIAASEPTMGVMVEAMKKCYLNKLQVVEIMTLYSGRDIGALCDALADGACPKINKLVIPGLYGLESSLGAALRSRMEEGKGCCGLKSLEVKGCAYYLSPLLSSGACEALEELKMYAVTSRAEEDLSEWLLRTKAPHLRYLHLPNITTSSTAITALCSRPGVAPMLQVLHLSVYHASLISLLPQAIGGGAWPHLRELRVQIEEGEGIMPSLMEAIGVGATELVRLHVETFGSEAAMALARMLRDGGCPRLEELYLSRIGIDDSDGVELWRALEGGAPCNRPLRRLCISSCGITPVVMRELMESMGRGALPHLELLNISDNGAIGDEGVMAVAEAMAGQAFAALQELNLFDVGMRGRGAIALFQAFRDHKACPHLKKLSVGSNDIGDDGVVELAKAIEAGALQHLQELDLRQVVMGEEGFKSLVKAIVAQQPNPGCPRLEVLDVGCNKLVGDNGVIYLAEMMKMEGVMQHLREIRLREVNLGKEAVESLFEALGDRHVCPILTKINLGANGREIHALTNEMKEMLVKRGRNRHNRKMTIEWY